MGCNKRLKTALFGAEENFFQNNRFSEPIPATFVKNIQKQFFYIKTKTPIYYTDGHGDFYYSMLTRINMD